MPSQAPGKQSCGHLPKSTSKTRLLSQTIIGAHLHRILHTGSMQAFLSSPKTATLESPHHISSLLSPFEGFLPCPLDSRPSPHSIHTLNHWSHPWLIQEQTVVGLAWVCLA